MQGHSLCLILIGDYIIVVVSFCVNDYSIIKTHLILIILLYDIECMIVLVQCDKYCSKL